MNCNGDMNKHCEVISTAMFLFSELLNYLTACFPKYNTTSD